MMNILVLSTFVQAFKAAIADRIAAQLRIDPSKPTNDYRQALNTLALFPNEAEQGFKILAECGDVKTPAELYHRMVNIDERDPLFMNQKCFDKLAGLAAWISCAIEWDGVRMRALALPFDQLARSGKLKNKDYFFDKHVAALCGRTIPEFCKFGRDGKPLTVSCTMREMRGFDSYRTALDDRGRGSMNLAQMQAWCDSLIEKGAADFHLATANTQGPQIKTMLIGMGLTKVKKYDGNGVWCSGRFAGYILAANAFHQIPARMFENRGRTTKR